IGTGERGLWWLAESDEGWTLSDDSPCVRIERLKDAVRLRIRIIGAKTILSGQRSFEFALLPEPVKPKPFRWRELAWGRGTETANYYGHDTCGYRYYGDSVDSYALHTEEDFAGLKAFLSKFGEQTPYYNWYTNHAKALRDGAPFVLYGSTWMTGLGMEEFKYYGFEWLGRENWKPSPDLSFEGVPSYGNTYRWTTPEQLTAAGVNFDYAQVDCFLWYHQRLFARCPANGTWWDNSSIGTFCEHVPGKGKIEKWNTFLRRELTRRLAVMGYETGRRPWWLQNMHVDFSWCQVGWHIENDFYIQGEAKDLIAQLGVHKFRALFRTKGGLVNQLHSNCPIPSFSAEENNRAERTIIGLCLLHDVGDRGLPRWCKEEGELLKRFLDPLEAHVAFFSGDPEFIPYWRQMAVPLTAPEVYASLFVGNGKTAMVLVNASRDNLRLKGFALRPGESGLKSVNRLFDAETGKALERGDTGWHDPTSDGVIIEPHGVRLLIAEGPPAG
ncbi:MAG: hypothetical protein HY360_07985, partial [Verrucomicrobia bacterium]|nr:hypothetical protein [Verrucomicrobiota bacterium]